MAETSNWKRLVQPEGTVPDTETKPETTTVVMNRDLASIVRTIADHRDTTMAEALEKYARPGLVREYRKVLDEMQRSIDAGGEG